MVIRTKRGLDLPLKGKPRQSIENAAPARQVALLGDDYPDLKPTMAVKSGDPVRKGQLLFTDKKNPQVHYTSPAAGIVTAIERGDKRRLLSVMIDVEGISRRDSLPTAMIPASSPVKLSSSNCSRVVPGLLSAPDPIARSQTPPRPHTRSLSLPSTRTPWHPTPST